MGVAFDDRMVQSRNRILRSINGLTAGDLCAVPSIILRATKKSLSTLPRLNLTIEFSKAFVLASIVACAGWFGTTTQSRAQSSTTSETNEQGGSYSELLPADRDEVADDERQTWTVNKIPPQPYMKEIYWDFSPDTPPFFAIRWFKSSLARMT